MKKFMVWCPEHRLYVMDCVPEDKSITLTTDKKEAQVSFKEDASIYHDYVMENTGLVFEMIPC